VQCLEITIIMKIWIIVLGLKMTDLLAYKIIISIQMDIVYRSLVVQVGISDATCECLFKQDSFCD
jgi:hypothetical protein